MLADGAECPTQFEVLTALGLYYFAKCQVEYAVIEVGLGGTLDSTNVITPEVSVITNVTMEHADKLGGTLQSIAENKAGIIKDGVPVVTVPQSERADSAADLLRRVAPAVQHVEAFEANKEALDRALELANGEKLLVIAGSLYLVGGVREMLLQRKG